MFCESIHEAETDDSSLGRAEFHTKFSVRGENDCNKRLEDNTLRTLTVILLLHWPKVSRHNPLDPRSPPLHPIESEL